MDNVNAREPYEPPVVEDIPLKSDEQVLAGCKGPGHNGPGPSSFQCIGLRGTCTKHTPS